MAYLAWVIETDFAPADIERIDFVLQDIKKLESREIEIAFCGRTFCHSLTPTHVVLEHCQFGECNDWPLWSCSLSNYKTALAGWRTFLDMPDNIQSELVVALPDAAP